jgi:hypothetical protein
MTAVTRYHAYPLALRATFGLGRNDMRAPNSARDSRHVNVTDMDEEDIAVPFGIQTARSRRFQADATVLSGNQIKRVSIPVRCGLDFNTF